MGRTKLCSLIPTPPLGGAPEELARAATGDRPGGVGITTDGSDVVVANFGNANGNTVTSVETALPDFGLSVILMLEGARQICEMT